MAFEQHHTYCGRGLALVEAAYEHHGNLEARRRGGIRMAGTQAGGLGVIR